MSAVHQSQYHWLLIISTLANVRTPCYVYVVCKLLENTKVFATWMACLLLCCTDAGEDESSCSICIMASIRCSGRLFQALSEPDSGEVSWTLSAVLRLTGIVRSLAAGNRSWDPCCVNGLTVVCGLKKPSSPERLWPTSAGWFAGVNGSSSIRGE